MRRALSNQKALPHGTEGLGPALYYLTLTRVTLSGQTPYGRAGAFARGRRTADTWRPNTSAIRTGQENSKAGLWSTLRPMARVGIAWRSGVNV